MHRLKLFGALIGLLAIPTAVRAETKEEPAKIVLDNFESDPHGWDFVPGLEFPGAKGDLKIDATAAHAGKRSYKLSADFRVGGAYVGTWRNLDQLKGREFKEIRFWAKASNLTGLGIRIVDSSDQCHQTKGVPLAATSDWQEVVLKIGDLVGGEHWGGANDAKWHGPAKGFGINIGVDVLGPDGKQGSLNIDDLTVVFGSAVEGHPTLLSAVVDPPACRPGYASAITYRWEAEPLGHDYGAFVHFNGPNGYMAFQADHAPSVATSIWSGHLEYTKKVLVPIDAKDGDYKIMLGLYDGRAADRGWDRQPLKMGDGVTEEKDRANEGTRAYQIGTLKVDSSAPVPKLPLPTLKLDGYEMTFDEEFKDLSVSAAGPGTRWCTNTKESFSDARFVEQKDGFPFSVKDGVLRIEAAKRNGGWQSGILASVDPKGRGFSQKFGYFEMRAKMPSGPGVWPAFWLLGQPNLTDKKVPNPEVDVLEYYGALPHSVCSTLHTWFPDGRHWAQGDFVVAPGLSDDFHDYGVMIDDANITFYFDGIEIQQQKTPPEHKVPLYMIVNLAMGSGWPMDKAVSPSYMYVKHVRAYAKRA